MCDIAIDCDDCRASTGGRCWKHPLSTGYNLPVADAPDVPLDPMISLKMLELDRDRERARAEAAEEDAREWRDTARQFAEKLGWFWDAIEKKHEVMMPLRLLYLKAERTPEEEDKFQRLLSECKKLPPISAENDYNRKVRAELQQSMDEITELLKQRPSAAEVARLEGELELPRLALANAKAGTVVTTTTTQGEPEEAER